MTGVILSSPFLVKIFIKNASATNCLQASALESESNLRTRCAALAWCGLAGTKGACPQYGHAYSIALYGVDVLPGWTCARIDPSPIHISSPMELVKLVVASRQLVVALVDLQERHEGP